MVLIFVVLIVLSVGYKGGHLACCMHVLKEEWGWLSVIEWRVRVVPTSGPIGTDGVATWCSAGE